MQRRSTPRARRDRLAVLRAPSETLAASCPARAAVDIRASPSISTRTTPYVSVPTFQSQDSGRRTRVETPNSRVQIGGSRRFSSMLSLARSRSRAPRSPLAPRETASFRRVITKLGLARVEYTPLAHVVRVLCPKFLLEPHLLNVAGPMTTSAALIGTKGSRGQRSSDLRRHSLTSLDRSTHRSAVRLVAPVHGPDRGSDLRHRSRGLPRPKLAQGRGRQPSPSHSAAQSRLPRQLPAYS